MDPVISKHSLLPTNLGPGDAFIVIDVQNDFLPGGSLSIDKGYEVVAPLNRYLRLFQKKQIPLFFSRDWHPVDHCSFEKFGGRWPAHCVAESVGAQFCPALDVPESAIIISKATEVSEDAYSCFQSTGLHETLQRQNIKRLFVGGLATDYCVLESVKDAVRLSYTVVVLEDAIRAVDNEAGDGHQALEEMESLGCQTLTLDRWLPYPQTASALLVDLYQINMMKSFWDRRMNQTAMFEFYVRRLPKERGFLLAAGLEQVLEYLETLNFSDQDLDWLKDQLLLPQDFLDYLKSFRFTGRVEALPEGTVFFQEEPVLRITAPLLEAQFVETRIINLLQYQTMIASKAGRIVLSAPGKSLVDFGLRRAHGAEAGLLSARASYLAGFSGTATVQAGALFDIPLYGTMAHSFVQVHDRESDAFEHFVRSHPQNTVLLLDTYHTEQAAEKVVTLASRLKKEGITIQAVRIDSGDLGAHSKKVRSILDAGDCPEIKILASSNLDEHSIRQLVQEGAPIDGFGIGTRLVTSQDVPCLECAYKLQEYDGVPKRKLAEGKKTWPGRKQVFRNYDDRGRMCGDILSLETEPQQGTPLLKEFLNKGRRLQPPTSLEASRSIASQQLNTLPKALKQLETHSPYPVEISLALEEFTRSLPPPRD